MEFNIVFSLGADRKDGEPRLWLYVDREHWPQDFRARLANQPQDVTVHIGNRAIAARIKAHAGDGSRTYVAAGSRSSNQGASWPGHREMTEHLRAMNLGPHDIIECRVITSD